VGVPGLQVSISIGLAPAPDGTLDLREWIEAADRALYTAKDAGRNRSVGLDAVAVVDGAPWVQRPLCAQRGDGRTRCVIESGRLVGVSAASVAVWLHYLTRTRWNPPAAGSTLRC
jgi:predicted signal transduction protein with EAL and GGDEF domain